MVLRLLKSTNVGWAWGKSGGFTTKNCNGTPPGGAPTLPCSRVSGLLVEARQSLQAFILFYHVNGC